MVIRILALVLCVLSLPHRARADFLDPPAPFDAYSDNRAYRFSVVPNKDLPGYGNCVGTLYQHDGRGGWLALWSRHLVNDHMPSKALVSDTGEFIVTLGDYGTYPKIAIAVYETPGELTYVITPSDTVTLFHPTPSRTLTDAEEGELDGKRHLFDATELDVLWPREKDERDEAIFIAPGADEFLMVQLGLGVRGTEVDYGPELWAPVKARAEAGRRARAAEADDALGNSE